MNEALRRALTKMSTGDSPAADIMAPVMSQAAKIARTAQQVDRHYVDATSKTPPTVTGSRGGNAALASMLSALEAAGILIDNTTP